MAVGINTILTAFSILVTPNEVTRHGTSHDVLHIRKRGKNMSESNVKKLVKQIVSEYRLMAEAEQIPSYKRDFEESYAAIDAVSKFFFCRNEMLKELDADSRKIVNKFYNEALKGVA